MSNQNHTLPPMGATENQRKFSRALPFIIVVLITVGIWFLMSVLKPEIEKKDDVAAIPMVETITIKPVDFVVPIVTEGMVLPKTSINFSAEIVGKITFVAPQFSNGGKFAAGDVLVKVDPKDYELAIVRSKANVAAALAQLDLDQAKSDLAKNDWDKYGKKGKPSSLNLNLPQVASAKAALAGAKADLLLAKRNLTKTSIVAPFDGVIFTKNVDVGQFVNIGTTLATIASTKLAEIRVALSDQQLQMSGLNDMVDTLKVIITSEETKQVQWHGQVTHIESQRDVKTLMNYVVIEIEKPFSQQPTPLRFNTFVEVEFAGETLYSVYPLERSYMMLNNKVKILDSNSQLVIRSVETAYADIQNFYISKGLNLGDKVITTQLPGIKSGATLKLAHIPQD
ncbi:hypothetical protein MNBD_GAMMA01-222 [hydrothermal vent metagenome]|uniref:Multidrug resistance protein MdtA-like barrel-sandwich hybrid domain-containing protein n=1 Tax=hydrothermal vent metagenome TaxID=652676 RepID=A0A3B0VIS6_9ZZZZ